MPSPVQSIFQDKLAIYKQQQAEINKDKGLAAQLKKSRNDFKQQRGVEYQSVVNTPTIVSEPNKQKARPMPIAGFVEGTEYNVGAGGPHLVQQGGQKLLNAGRTWRTSGYHLFSNVEDRKKITDLQAQKKDTSLWRLNFLEARKKKAIGVLKTAALGGVK